MSDYGDGSRRSDVEEMLGRLGQQAESAAEPEGEETEPEGEETEPEGEETEPEGEGTESSESHESQQEAQDRATLVTETRELAKADKPLTPRRMDSVRHQRTPARRRSGLARPRLWRPRCSGGPALSRASGSRGQLDAEPLSGMPVRGF